MTAPTVARGRTGSRSISAALEDLASLPTHTVANAPSAAANTGQLIYVSNGASGSACLAYSNGISWLRIALGAAIAAS